ncbi:MAG: hypothetical protein HY064_09970 [Bacteroidetes bacterium]|nr:hypothetical protein [Bacteroidota bacterium]
MKTNLSEPCNKVDLGFAVYEKRSDDVIVLRLTDDLRIDSGKAELMNGALTKITGGKPKKILVMNGKFTSADHDARILLASNQKLLQVEKVAVTIYSLSQRLLANFFLQFNKPSYRIRFFTDAGSAEKWLLDKRNNQ